MYAYESNVIVSKSLLPQATDTVTIMFAFRKKLFGLV